MVHIMCFTLDKPPSNLIRSEIIRYLNQCCKRTKVYALYAIWSATTKANRTLVDVLFCISRFRIKYPQVTHAASSSSGVVNAILNFTGFDEVVFNHVCSY